MKPSSIEHWVNRNFMNWAPVQLNSHLPNILNLSNNIEHVPTEQTCPGTRFNLKIGIIWSFPKISSAARTFQVRSLGGHCRGGGDYCQVPTANGVLSAAPPCIEKWVVLWLQVCYRLSHDEPHHGKGKIIYLRVRDWLVKYLMVFQV